MLVLSRRTDEYIVLTDEDSGSVTRVGVIEIQGSNKVRLGIEAPKSVKVLREEVLKHPTLQQQYRNPAI